MVRYMIILTLLYTGTWLFGQDIGGDYYVVPSGGNDNNDGSYENPWATWQAAFERARPGDTVYFRGGVWYPQDHFRGSSVTEIHVPDGIGNNGTAEEYICFFNYPGENPILDCAQVDTIGNDYNGGLSLTRASFIHFRGLTIRNVYQPYSGKLASGIGSSECSNLIFENLTVHDIGGRGISYWGANGYYDIEYDTTRWINCDVYDCLDLLSQEPGNGSDGWKFDNEDGAYFYLHGCRAWNCGDDGFDVSGSAKAIFDHCWSFSHAFEQARDGNGFKFGANRGHGAYLGNDGEVVIGSPVPGVLREVRNCIAAFNIGIGVYELGYTPYYRVNSRIYNNTIYRNGIGIQMEISGEYDEPLSIWRNNIVYGCLQNDAGNRPYNLVVTEPYIESNNTWDYADNSIVGSLMWWIPTDSVTVTDDDFVMIDSAQGVAQMMSPRKADGSLPDIDFLHLAQGSDLIDAGVQIPCSDKVDFGSVWCGLNPDLGAFEYGSSSKLNVQILTPIDGARLSSSELLDIEAIAASSDGTITGVEFYVCPNESMIAEDFSDPWSATWFDPTVGSHFLWAKANNTDGCYVNSSCISVLISHFPDTADCFLYPNPNNGIFTLQLAEKLPYTSELHFISYEGKTSDVKLVSEGEDFLKFDISDLIDGVYNLVFINSEGYYPCDQSDIRVLKITN